MKNGGERDKIRLRREWRRDMDHGLWNGWEILGVGSSIHVVMVFKPRGV